MKRSIHSLFALGVVAGFASLISPTAVFAGAGSQAWQPKASKTSAAVEMAAPASAEACAGSALVAAKTMAPTWANARGPLAEKTFATKRVCTMCPATEVAIVGWKNGRGPSEVVLNSRVGASHDCTGTCMGAKS